MAHAAGLKHASPPAVAPRLLGGKHPTQAGVEVGGEASSELRSRTRTVIVSGG